MYNNGVTVFEYFVASYIILGFIYAVYVVMSRGGGLFTIPINTILGPLFFPVFVIQTYLSFRSKR
ncbi:hypothetical protein HY419_00040 [candidate division WWE3 bacterium]|nr:hypothetical protein [candidate division WWE3 bacterium]